MLEECVDQVAIAKAIPLSVSCSHWHRKHMQCGHCVPCLIRRSSIHHAGFTQDAPYVSKNLKFVHNDKGTRDDLHAVQTAITRLNKSQDYKGWIRQSGSLPNEQTTREKLESTIRRGLKEVETFLEANKI